MLGSVVMLNVNGPIGRPAAAAPTAAAAAAAPAAAAAGLRGEAERVAVGAGVAVCV